VREQPDIVGEIRGLLEEIAADPRSSARFTPRRALREWFDGGEALRARSMDGTRAERHLVAAHREGLAATLLEAAKIAYWKDPVLSLRPIEPGGALYDERAAEERWRPSAQRRAERATESGAEVELLRACITQVRPEHGHDLALASLSLVPSDAARYFVTRTLPWDRPRTAISLLRRLAALAKGPIRVHALSSLACRLCAIEELSEARAFYLEAAHSSSAIPDDWFFLFNLSCLLGDVSEASMASRELGEIVGGNHPRTKQVAELCARWWATRSSQDRSVAARVSARLSGSLSEAARAICLEVSP
jgi:hypothetical protein